MEAAQQAGHETCLLYSIRTWRLSLAHRAVSALMAVSPASAAGPGQPQFLWTHNCPAAFVSQSNLFKWAPNLLDTKTRMCEHSSGVFCQPLTPTGAPGPCSATPQPHIVMRRGKPHSWRRAFQTHHTPGQRPLDPSQGQCRSLTDNERLSS